MVFTSAKEDAKQPASGVPLRLGCFTATRSTFGWQHIHFKRGSMPRVSLLFSIQASKPGGLMAVGSCPNKKGNDVFATLEEADADFVGLAKARCFGKLNRKEGKDPYHKPTVLFARMLEIFNIGSDGTRRKINEQDMHNWLRGERDPVDGGLKFCHFKKGSWPWKQYCEQCKNNPCNCNGMCPPKWMCDQFITTQTQKRKKANTTK
jgi:hypothetical protein